MQALATVPQTGDLVEEMRYEIARKQGIFELCFEVPHQGSLYIALCVVLKNSTKL